MPEGQPWGHGHGGWPAGTSSAPPPPPLPPAVPGMHAGGQPCPGCSYACRSVKGLHTCIGTIGWEGSIGGHGHGGWPAGTSSAPPPPPLPPAVPGMHAGGQPCPGCSYACRSVKGLHTCRGTRSRRDSPASLAMGAGQLAPAARRHRHRCRQQWPECMLVRSPEQDAPMPGSPSGGCTPVGVLDAGGTALGTWPWGLASWHQQRAATATAAASSARNACWWAALSRMLLCL